MRSRFQQVSQLRAPRMGWHEWSKKPPLSHSLCLSVNVYYINTLIPELATDLVGGGGGGGRWRRPGVMETGGTEPRYTSLSGWGFWGKNEHDVMRLSGLLIECRRDNYRDGGLWDVLHHAIRMKHRLDSKQTTDLLSHGWIQSKLQTRCHRKVGLRKLLTTCRTKVALKTNYWFVVIKNVGFKVNTDLLPYKGWNQI